jgi:hypothetical protein
MPDETPRSRAARAAAEQALIRVVHHYGGRPEFVLLGGLVPELLCSTSDVRHAGTTDVDVQVDLEIALGSTSAGRLERALRNAEFAPDGQRAWRWVAAGPAPRVVVKFELLADQDDLPSEATVTFDGCDDLGAVNLRGTGYASRDVEVRQLRARIGGVDHTAELNVTGLAGFLLAKAAAAWSRRKTKDWYDIAYVLLHNDAGGPDAAADAVVDRFGPEVAGFRTSLMDLRANFSTPDAQGPTAYADQLTADHPEVDRTTATADAVIAIERFTDRVLPRLRKPR